MAYIRKTWSVDRDTIDSVEKGQKMLRSTESYALREIVALGIQQLENLKKKPYKEGA